MNQQPNGKTRQNHSATGLHGAEKRRNPATGIENRDGRGSTKQPRRCAPSSRRKKELRSAEPVTDGFLNHSFSPIVAQDEMMNNQNAIETAFWLSLTNLSDAFGLDLCATDLEWGADFPLNIVLAHQKASEALARKRSDLSLMIAEDDELPPGLMVCRVVPTTYTAYFFGLDDLWKRLQKKKVSPLWQVANALSVSALAYLRQVVGIESIWQEGEMRWAVEAYIEMTREGEEDEPGTENTAEFHQKAFTKLIQKAVSFDSLVNDKSQLSGFATHYRSLLAVAPTSKRKGGLGVKTHTDMLAVAGALLRLYQDYPSRDYADSFKLGAGLLEDEFYIGPDSRIGFVWNQDDWTAEILHQNLEMEFNSGAEVIEPVSVHHFSEPLPASGFADDFDERLFAALDRLHHLL